MTKLVLTTGMSRAHWWSRNEGFAPAVFTGALADGRPSGKPDKAECWVDLLFEGEIVLPEADDRRALTLLLTGPPGAGKSTFALELCYRALLEQRPRGKQKPTPPRCLYVSSESNLSLMRQQATSFGWTAREWLYGAVSEKRQEGPPFTAVLETNDFRDLLLLEKIPWLEHFPKLKVGVPGVEADLNARPGVEKLAKRARHRTVARQLNNAKPDILIIDSLNNTAPDNHAELFATFNELVTGSGDPKRHLPKLIVFVLDSPQRDHDFWGYSCDIIVRLDRHYGSDYMVRTIEIEKARYQAHAWGNHQLKIYARQAPNNDLARRRQQHPYRSDGGIFVFPSIHFYLSRYKRTGPTELKYVTTPFRGLDQMLGTGLPAGRCVALLGARGGHKSHFGYRHVLEQLSRTNDAALIVSLRDDEPVAQKKMDQILEHEVRPKTVTVGQLIANDRLEIMYFPPGYITPEEFFHRVCIGVQRLKRAGQKRGNHGRESGEPGITLLFNSVDQLNSRFPLCAKEHIFVPGLIQMLNAEGITSIFIGVEESGQPDEQYGLLSMADTILRASRNSASWYEILPTLPPVPDQRHFEERIKQDDDIIVLEVVRVAAGHAAGGRGLLDLMEKLDTVGKGDVEIEERTRRLVFTPAKRLPAEKRARRTSQIPQSSDGASHDDSGATDSVFRTGTNPDLGYRG